MKIRTLLLSMAAVGMLFASFFVLNTVADESKDAQNTTVAADVTKADEKAEEVKPMELTDANFDQEVTNSKVPVVIDFGTSWCGWCIKMAPHVDEIAKLYKGKVKVMKCDADAYPTLAAKYGVNLYPTVITVKPGAKGFNTHIGYQDLKALKKMCDNLIKP